MQLIGRRTSVFTILAAAELMLLGAPGCSAAPAAAPVAVPVPEAVAVAVVPEVAPVPTMAPAVDEAAILETRGRDWNRRIKAAQRKKTTTTTAKAATTTPAKADYWIPTQDTTWQIQLSGTINTNVAVDAMEIDADVDQATINKLKAKGIKLVAYFSGGSYENWRDDAKSFPKEVIGKPLDGWEGENWLDIRAISKLQPIMEARARKAKAKGFDAIDWDNVDGYTQKSGFTRSAAEQVTYNKMLAQITHALGMSVALKNDLNNIPALMSSFDFAVNEQCGFYEECDMYKAWLNAGKAVLSIEYPGYDGDKRTYAQVKAQIDPRMYGLIKKMNLGSWAYSLRKNAQVSN